MRNKSDKGRAGELLQEHYFDAKPALEYTMNLNY